MSVRACTGSITIVVDDEILPTKASVILRSYERSYIQQSIQSDDDYETYGVFKVIETFTRTVQLLRTPLNSVHRCILYERFYGT